MDFAKKQLEKYGWIEGKGLGKEENGIKDAIKPKQKRGTTGIGHDMAEEFTNEWWHKVYNNAADNVESTDDKRSQDAKPVKRKAVPNQPLYFTNFVKSATLNGGKTESLNEDVQESSSEDEFEAKCKRLTDEELFSACGGRTAHKGARHGLKSDGKLKRIDEQERLFLENYKKRSQTNSEQNISDTKSKKKNKSKTKK